VSCLTINYPGSIVLRDQETKYEIKLHSEEGALWAGSLIITEKILRVIKKGNGGGYKKEELKRELMKS
jgi:hypothetical protein